MKKVITMFVLSALVVCLSECVTGGKRPAAGIAQTDTVSAMSDKFQGETVLLSELSSKSKEDALPSQEEWKTAYENKLNEFYEKKNNILRYAVRDFDGNGVPELILSKYPKITIYSYEQEIQKIYEEDFFSGTRMFLVSENDSCPGVFHFWVDGGLEHYGYLSMTDSTIHDEELWNEDYSGISKELGIDRGRILEISEDTILIQESKKAYEERNELHFQNVSQHNEIEVLENKMVMKPEAADVVFAFEDWVNKMVWMLGKDIYIGEQEYLDRDKTAEIYYKRLDAGKRYEDQAFETYLYFPYKNGKGYECFTFVMDMHGFATDPLKRNSDCKTIQEGLTYLGTGEYYFNSEYTEQPYYLTDKKTALVERMKQQMTELYLSFDDEEDPWEQVEVYIMDFDKKEGYTQAVIVRDHKEISVCSEVTWNVMLENGKISDRIHCGRYGASMDLSDPTVMEKYQEMMDAAICHFVIKR